MKKILAFVLAFLMVLAIFAGCQSSKTEEPIEPAPDNTSKEDPKPEEDVKEPETTEPDEPEIAEIAFWLADFGTDISGKAAVEDAINAITEEKIGVHVNITTIATGDYGTQLNLAVTNNESVDLAMYMGPVPASWTTFYSNGLMMDMKDLIPTYGKDLISLMGEDLVYANTIGDGVYGISNYRVLNSNLYAGYRTDMLKEAGVLDVFKSMTTWAEYEDVMQALVEKTDSYPLGGSYSQPAISSMAADFGTTSWTEGTVYDELGDSLNAIWSDDEGHVANAYARDEFIAKLKLTADWYSKGYIYPDSSISQESPDSCIQQGLFAGTLVICEYGIEASKASTWGSEVTALELIPGMITTRLIRNWGMFIPASSQEPEAAMTFLNLLYNDSDLMNLILYGIEGVNYEVKDGVGYYMDGKDSSSSGYHLIGDFLLGNQFLALPWAGALNGSHFREDALENFKNASTSKYVGLSVDLSNYDNLIAAISSVRGEYYFRFTNGLYNEDMYSEFLSKLTAAGVDEYVGIFQAAADSFLA